MMPSLTMHRLRVYNSIHAVLSLQPVNLLSRSMTKLMEDIGMLARVLGVAKMVILWFGKMNFIRNFLLWSESASRMAS